MTATASGTMSVFGGLRYRPESERPLGTSLILSIRLPVDVERRLNAIAERTGRSQSEHAREAILRYLEEFEDELIAAERLERPERRWTLDELERELDLER
jgi:RHH-type rel operon transcriptional repressor/antitoxin RelB